MRSPATSSSALLITDVEGSARLWERHGNRIAPVLALHDELVRAVCAENGGTEIRSEGDALFFRFGTTMSACSAAVLMQQRLTELKPTIRTRIGIVRLSANRVTTNSYRAFVESGIRLRDAAIGGMILLSEAVADEIGAAATPDARLLCLGPALLRGETTPKRLYQLTYPGDETVGAPIRIPANVPNNLPQIACTKNSKRCLDASRSALRLLSRERARLVTVCCEELHEAAAAVTIAAHAYLSELPDAIWQVALRRTPIAAHLDQLTRTTLSDGRGKERAAASTILRHRHVLLVAKAQGAAPRSSRQIADLLAELPGLSFAVAATAPLKLLGEHVVRIESSEDAGHERCGTRGPAAVLSGGHLLDTSASLGAVR